MRDTSKSRIVVLAVVIAVTGAAGLIAKISARRAPVPVFSADDFHDAVGSPIPLSALAGKGAAGWFKAPESRRSDIDAQLYASRRLHALGRQVAAR